jgi:cytochrome b
METKSIDKRPEIGQTVQILVWDLPIRLFHWLLVVCVILTLVSGNIGGNAMNYHMLGGYAILVLLIFRITWGIVGSRTARFSSFVKGPATVFSYAGLLLKKNTETPYLGHNPLGGWSIVAMLAGLFTQAATGLFANDDILIEGPLYGWVSKDASDLITRIHLINRYLLVGLIAVHVLAVFFYLFFKHENLIRPMITGRKRWHTTTVNPIGSPILAAVIFGLAVLAVYLLVQGH